MKQISNNSSKEIVICLGDYERALLKNFITELKNNSAVECITMEPTIENHGKNLFSHIKFNVVVFGRNPESLKVAELMEYYGKELPEVANACNLYDLNIIIDNLGLADEEYDQFLSGPDFISSYIVYDKDGVYSAVHEKIIDRKEVKPRSYTIGLDSIEDLYTESRSTKGTGRK